uniref:Uncharacterized protein n=1 Tax=Rhizophora mucronata TaxID=61149 RepID=A0A2P2QPN4_RHIMU
MCMGMFAKILETIHCQNLNRRNMNAQTGDILSFNFAFIFCLFKCFQ